MMPTSSPGPVQHRAAGVAADRVRRRDEVERRRQVEFVLRRPASASAGRTARWCPCFSARSNAPPNVVVERQLLAVDLVALHHAERQPQRERRVRRRRPCPSTANRALAISAYACRSGSSTSFSYRLRSSRASASISAGQARSSGRRLASIAFAPALDQPLALGRVGELRAGDQLVGPRPPATCPPAP